MSETKHTPGPWRVNKYGSIGAGERGTEPIVAMVEPFYSVDKRHGDHATNARLIAAAPDMAKALEIIAKAELYDPATGIIDADVLEACQAAARAALAKARGLA